MFLKSFLNNFINIYSIIIFCTALITTRLYLTIVVHGDICRNISQLRSRKKAESGLHEQKRLREFAEWSINCFLDENDMEKNHAIYQKWPVLWKDTER